MKSSKTSYSQNMFFLRNMFYSSMVHLLIFFTALFCCCSLWLRFLLRFTTVSFPFHVCRFLLLNIRNTYSQQGIYVRKKSFPKTKRNLNKHKAELMELFISHIHNSIYVMKLRTERLEAKKKHKCFMKLAIQGHPF